MTADNEIKPGEKMPVLFIGHGSPMNMILENGFTRSLAQLGRSLPRPEAVMVISAHWLTQGTCVTCAKKPRMIYDFFGFPAELYEIRYDCPGGPECVNLARDLTGAECDMDSGRAWGLDHAAYSPLRHMYPAADIPVFEMSLDYSFNNWAPKPLEHHYALAKRLSELRRRGVLILCSGNMIHNLDRIAPVIDAPPYDWALEIDERLKYSLLYGDQRFLLSFPNSGKDGSLAAPTLDHYLPMVYALGLQESNEKLKFTYEGIQNGSISMRSFQIG